MNLRVRMLSGLVTVLTLAVLAPAASASVSPNLTLSQGGTAAGSSVSLTTSFTFSPTSGDSPKDIALALPPGLLANATIDGGACLTKPAIQSACQVGSGSVHASTILGLPVPVAIPIAMYLVAPPRAGDLAGIQIKNTTPLLGGPLGSPGDVTIRPSDAGVNIAFSGVPNTFKGLPISVQSMSTTLTGMRLPTRCGSAAVSATVDSYKDPTARTTSAPLRVTGCSSLPFTPTFAVSAVKDRADGGVQVTTDVRQSASPPQSTSGTVVLTLPNTVLAPNVQAVLNGGILCANPASGTCKAIGSASSTSPLYPATLTGKAYLTGSLAAPAIALVFPPPFPITLAGKVNLATGSTTFTGVPDLPLTDLNVTLTGGPNSVFLATCNPSAGVASSALTSQDGSQTVIISQPFTVSGCTSSSSGGGGGSGGSGGGSGGQGGGSGSGSGSGGGGGSGSGAHPGHAHHAKPPRLTYAALSGLGSGHVTLRLRVVAGRGAARLRSLTIVLPAGLRWRTGTSGLSALFVSGGPPAYARIVHGRLTVRLLKAARAVTVRIVNLSESGSLRRHARHHHLKRPKLVVGVLETDGVHSVLRASIRHLRL